MFLLSLLSIFKIKLIWISLCFISTFKGSEKFCIKVGRVYLNDGTEIEDDEVLMSLEAGTVLHLETSQSFSTKVVGFCSSSLHGLIAQI